MSKCNHDMCEEDECEVSNLPPNCPACGAKGEPFKNVMDYKCGSEYTHRFGQSGQCAHNVVMNKLQTAIFTYDEARCRFASGLITKDELEIAWNDIALLKKGWVMTDISKWKVGDRAYISGHPEIGAFSHGDIVHVTWVNVDTNTPCAGREGHRINLKRNDRCPLRVLATGETIPMNTVTQRLERDGTLSFDHRWTDDCVVTSKSTWVFISLPHDEKVIEAERRLEKAQEELEEARKLFREACNG